MISWQLLTNVNLDLCFGISEELNLNRTMVLRKAVVALLLLRIIENRRSLNASAILHRLACIRAILSKNPLLASMFAAAEPVVAAVLQRARRQVDCAAVAVQSKLQSHPLLHPITNTSYVRHVLEFLRALIVKIDCALKALAPFARFRIVCSVLRRKQRTSHSLDVATLGLRQICSYMPPRVN